MPAATQDDMKRAAAARALDEIAPGMRLGLGTGSTARHFVALLGQRVRLGLRVVGVPTSEATRTQAQSLGIPLTDLDETPELDLTVDGADEFDADLRLIKGGGGALLREKIVAAASRRMIVIADSTKEVGRLGRYPLPVEATRFGLGATRRALEAAFSASGCGGPIALRRGAGGQDFATDGGHVILDCNLGAIPDPERLATRLDAIPGVMGHGLFLGLADTIICADPDALRIIERRAAPGAPRTET